MSGQMPVDMPPMPRTGPDCGNPPESCRLIMTSTIQDPPIEWNPEYNGLGQMTNSDPNTFINTYTCNACAGEWQDTRTSNGSSTRTILKEPRRI